MDAVPIFLLLDRKDATMKSAIIIDFIAYRKQRLNQTNLLAHAVSEELILEIKDLIERLRTNQPQKYKK